MSYVVEKDVPLPAARGPVARPCPYPFAQMALGDSFLATLQGKRTIKKLRAHITCVAKRYRDYTAADFAIRTRVEDGGKAVRVWRVPYQPKAKPRLVIVPAPESYTHLLDKPRKGGKPVSA